jgi:hypothetical protein
VTAVQNLAKDITLIGTDGNGDTLTALIDTLPSHGTVSLAGNVATYQPDTDYLGADSFSFKMLDASSTSTEATVSISVEQSLLKAHWALDEGSGSVATDSSVYGRADGIIANGTWVTGIKGNALDFNGTSTTVTLPTSTFSSISNEITIAMWVYGGDTLPGYTSTFHATDAAGNGLLHILLPWNRTVFWDAGDSTGYDRIQKTATESEYKGEWHHWVFTKNATTGEMNIYHNGALWLRGTGNTKPIGAITSAWLGSQSTANFYDGAINDVQVYNSALTDGEVYDLYLDLK